MEGTPFGTVEEAEANRVRIVVEGTQALIEDYKKDIIKCEEKILELRN